MGMQIVCAALMVYGLENLPSAVSHIASSFIVVVLRLVDQSLDLVALPSD